MHYSNHGPGAVPHPRAGPAWICNCWTPCARRANTPPPLWSSVAASPPERELRAFHVGTKNQNTNSTPRLVRRRFMQIARDRGTALVREEAVPTTPTNQWLTVPRDRTAPTPFTAPTAFTPRGIGPRPIATARASASDPHPVASHPNMRSGSTLTRGLTSLLLNTLAPASQDKRTHPSSATLHLHFTKRVEVTPVG